MTSRSSALFTRLFGISLVLACALPEVAAAQRMGDDEDIVRPRKRRSGGGGSFLKGGHHFEDSDPEATFGVGPYAFFVAPNKSRDVPTKGGGIDTTALLMVPFSRDTDFAMIFGFRNQYGGFSPAGFHFDLRMSLGLALGLGPLAAGPFVGIGLDGMPRLGGDDQADFPRIPAAAEAHYGAVVRFVQDRKLTVEAVGTIDKRTCSDVTESGSSPFEVCSLTRLEGRVQLMTSSDAGIFASLRWDNAGHSSVWGLTVGVAPNPK